MTTPTRRVVRLDLWINPIFDQRLADVPAGITRKHYNHALMADQVRAAMQSWADHIWEIAGKTN